MNFRRPPSDEPEINLIPFIDVLLVVLIFLMLSTTYSKFTELQITLPVADADPTRERPAEIHVAVAADGRFQVDGVSVDGHSVEALSEALQLAAPDRARTAVIISADAMVAHQSVVNVLDAARRAGLVHVTFAAQLGSGGGKAAAAQR